ncbi:cell adhesion molecule CEACAM7-like [Carettochelys insculpta]|uniref:cell adhesion molecule CEACAM7-like n=1 Tax=Carettochelys insculpta TaxID=44489 RepID=UPI003EBBA8D8
MGRVPPTPSGPWAGLLLAASVLVSRLQPAPAQTSGTIVLTPPSPAVGGTVSLALQDPPQDFTICNWYRSAIADQNTQILVYFPQTPVQNNGPAHTGRETAGPGCSLHIAGLRLSDTGNYTVYFQGPNLSVTSTAVLRVFGAPTPPGASSGLSAGAIAGIVIGSLAGVALVGVGASFFYCRCREDPPQENGAPVLVYENMPPTARMEPEAPCRSPPDPSPTYQTLQPRQPDVYEELKK